jgi:hypothetical protein
MLMDNVLYEAFRLLRSFLRSYLMQQAISERGSYAPRGSQVRGSKGEAGEVFEGDKSYDLVELLSLIESQEAALVASLGTEFRGILSKIAEAFRAEHDGKRFSRDEILFLLRGIEVLTLSLGGATVAGLIHDLGVEFAGDEYQPSIADEVPVEEGKDLEPVTIPAELRVGAEYTREDIHHLMGGSMQEFLPHVGFRIVCGAFTPRTNPDAPDIVTVPPRRYVERWARAFATQKFPIPIFLKRSVGAWEYVGNYLVEELSEDPEMVREYARRIGREDVAMLLFLKKHPSTSDHC